MYRFVSITVSTLLLMILSACGATHVKIDGQNTAGVTSQHGKELWLSVVPLTGVGGINANGAAQAHYFEDGVFVLLLQLNIDPAPKGSLYTGWLLKQDGTDPKSLGMLVNPSGDVRHQAPEQPRAESSNQQHEPKHDSTGRAKHRSKTLLESVLCPRYPV